MRIGALEAGGTKMVCAIGDENGNIFDKISVKTSMPEDTIPLIYRYFSDNNIDSLGIASFGPVDLNRNSDTYGYITSTPKKGWSQYDIVGAFKGLGVPIGFDTDVNGSVLGEASFGIGKGIKNLVYITIGTGIGAGVISEGRLLHGMLHPEAGHMTLKRHPEDESFVCNCPFHESCFEGLAAGPSIEKRFGVKANELPENHLAWDIEAYYIAQALVNITCILSPERFILGGGVSHQLQLFPLIRREYEKQLNGYIRTKEIKDLDHYIVPQSLDDNQGILGAIKLGVLEKE